MRTTEWGRRLLPAVFAVLVPLQAAAGPDFSDPALRIKVTPFRSQAGQVFWSQDGGTLYYAQKGEDKYYDIRAANPDGSADRCLTCDHPGLPNKHIGCPVPHPSGKYILFTAEKARHGRGSFDAIPGFGGYTDIWVMTTDASRVYQLTDLPDDYDSGILPPKFSADGSKVVWSERVKAPNFFSAKGLFGMMAIKTADFVETPEGPRLANVKSFQPGGEAFYETYGFSPDGSRILFCSSMHQRSVWDQQIWTMDAETGGGLRQLTNGDYNEHAFYTPDGGHILWMTNAKSYDPQTGKKLKQKMGTDWWIMKTDGSDKRRLSFFNVPAHPQYRGGAVWAGPGSFNPDGTRFAADIQKSLITQETEIVMAELLFS